MTPTTQQIEPFYSLQTFCPNPCCQDVTAIQAKAQTLLLIQNNYFTTSSNNVTLPYTQNSRLDLLLTCIANLFRKALNLPTLKPCQQITCSQNQLSYPRCYIKESLISEVAQDQTPQKVRLFQKFPIPYPVTRPTTPNT